MEDIVTSLANFLGGGITLLFGLILRFVNGSEGLIAGYNTMSNTEKDKWNATKMRIFLGNVLILSSCILLVAGVFALLGIYPAIVVIVSWVLFVALLVFCVVYLNTSSKFKLK